MPTKSGKLALIMAGGTGGHIFPAKAVADKLAEEGWQIAWLGTADRMEAKLVPQFGYPLHTIAVSGVRGKGWASRLLAPWMVARAVWQAMRLCRQLQPDLVIGFGGYASGPGGLAAWLQGVPLLIHEQNAVAGTTNKLLAKFAKAVLVAFPQAFAGHPKQRVTGNPVRPELIGKKPQNNCAEGLNILVVGGSLGARIFNQTLPAIFKQAAAFGAIRVRHQTGSAELEATQALYAEVPSTLDAQVTAFIDDMAQAYAWADVVICRAGALTVSEIASAGVAAVFVPLPSAIDDHQTANAGWLSERGAALRVKQADLSEQFLLPLLQHWVEDKTPLQHMATQARVCAIDNATAQVVEVCRRFTGVDNR